MSGIRRFAVRSSPVHGKGVFACVDIPKGERILEYKGKRISWESAIDMEPADPENPNHTFFFDIDGDTVIDGGDGGNAARWVNHSCSPNCRTEQVEVRGEDRIYIHAKRDIRAGEELAYDYGLILSGRITKADIAAHRCLCGSKNCRGTMLALPKKKTAAQKTAAKKAAPKKAPAKKRA